MANEVIKNAGIVTLNGMTNTVIISGDTYTGTAYQQEEIARAVIEKDIVVAQGVVYDNEHGVQRLEIGYDKTFIADNITMAGSTVTGGQKGGAIDNHGATTISSGTFSDNTASNGGAMFIGAGNVNISKSVFTGNHADISGGAISISGSYDGKVTLTVSDTVFSHNTSTSYGGAIFGRDGNYDFAVTIRDCVFATETDSVKVDGSRGFLTLGGTIWTAAQFSSENAVTVEANTKLVLDFSVHSKPGTFSMLENFDRMFSTSQNKLTISINVAANQANGTYNLAWDVSTLAQQNFTVTVDGNATKNFTVSIGKTTFYDAKNYTLKIDNRLLSLVVETPPTGIVTKKGDTDTVIISGDTYTGNAYSQDKISQAVAEQQVVAAQNVACTNTRLEIKDNQKFIGDTISMSGNKTGERGGAIYSNSTLTITDGIFADNTAGSTSAGGAIYSKNVLTISDSTFNQNTGAAGGAIVNTGTATISGSTFNQNTATRGGAIYNEGVLTISGSTFNQNTATRGGAIFNFVTLTIQNSTFTGNHSDNIGGAIFNWGTLTITGSTFTGNSSTTEEGVFCNVDTATIRDSVFATTADTIFNTGNLTLGGTIWTAANITSENAITVEADTKLVLDLSVYAGPTSKELLTDFNKMFGTSQEHLTISIKVGTHQIRGRYALATNAATLTQQNFTVTVGNDETKSFIISVGEEKTYESHVYALFCDGGILALSVRDEIDTGVVTLDGGTDTVVIGGVTYTGGKYAQSEIADALIRKGTIAAQGVSYTGTRLNVNSDRIFVADTILMSGNTTTGNGGAICNAGTTTILDGTFSGNTAEGNGGAIYNAGTAIISGSTFRANNGAYDIDGGAIYNLDTAMITGSLFIGNAASTGGAIYNAGTATVEKDIFIGNTSKAFGGAISNHYNGDLTLTGSTFTGNAASNGGAIYNFGFGTTKITISDSIFTGNAAGNGGAIYNAGTATIRDSVFTTASDTLYNDGVLTLGGTIWTAANIYSENTISVENNTQLVLDLSAYAEMMETELLTDYNEMFGASQSNLSITVNVSSSQTAVEYTLATGAAAFDKTITVTVDGVFRGTVGVGGSIEIGGEIFALNLKDDCLMFGVSSTGVVTKNGDTDTVVIGGVTYMGDKYAQSQIKSALRKNVTVAAQDVSYTGTRLEIVSEQTFAADTITMSGNTAIRSSGGAIYNAGTATIFSGTFSDNTAIYGGAIENSGTLAVSGSTFLGNVALGGAVYNAGTATIRDSVFTTVSDTLYNNGILTLGGTVTTAANITSTGTVSVDENTLLVLDLSVYAGTMPKELLTNFDTMFGTTQSNLSITVNVEQDQAVGIYNLATNAASFNCPIMLTVENIDIAPLDFVTKVVSGDKAYRLARNDQDLQLVVENFSEKKIFGGGTVSSDTVISEETLVNITGGHFVAAAGGVYATNCRVTMNAATNVSVADGSFSNIVCAGSIVNENTVLTVNDTSRLTISGGTFANAVAGGNYIQRAGGTVYGGRGAKASNTHVNITGGTFLRDIYGGNIAAQNSFVSKGNCYITGSTNITVNATDKTVFIGGNLVAGSSGQGQVIGSTNLTFKGNSDNLVFGAKSIICGDSHDATTAVSCVSGSRNLTFDGFTGELDAKVVGFDQIKVSGGSVTLAKSSRLSDVSGWEFAAGATLTFGDADNNFAGDRLSFGSFDGNEWTVVTGNDDSLVNWDWADQVTIAGQNASFDESLGCWTSIDYKFYKEDNALKVAKLA